MKNCIWKEKSETHSGLCTYSVGGERMKEYTTFTELEELLLTTIGLSGSSIKEITAATGIKANTLYKWKSQSPRRKQSHKRAAHAPRIDLLKA